MFALLLSVCPFSTNRLDSLSLSLAYYQPGPSTHTGHAHNKDTAAVNVMRDIVLGKEVLNDEEVSSLSPGEIKPLHWIKNSPFLRVKINSPNVADRGWHWSSPFDVSEVADYPVKVHSLALSLFLSRFLLLALSVGPPQLTLGLPSFVKIRYTDSMQNRSAYILPVEVKPAGSTTHIVFDKQHEEFPPYRLQNRCPHISLRYRQKAVNCQWEYLDPLRGQGVRLGRPHAAPPA